MSSGGSWRSSVERVRQMEARTRTNRGNEAGEVRDKNGKAVRSSRGRPLTIAWLKLYQGAFGQGRFEEFCRKHNITPKILPKGPEKPQTRKKATKGPRSGRQASSEESDADQKKEREGKGGGKAPEERIKGRQSKGTFRATFSNLGEFRQLISGIAGIIEEGTLLFAPEGIRFRAMDPSRVAMVDFIVPHDKLESYDINGNVPIGINFGDLKNWLKSNKPRAKLVVEKRENENQLSMTARDTISVNGSIPLLDIAYDEGLNLPKTHFNTSAKVERNAFFDAVKAGEVVSDYIKIETVEEKGDKGLELSAEGDRGCQGVRLMESDGVVLDLDAREQSKALYSLGYLEKAKALPGEIVQLEFSTNKLAKLTFSFDDGGLCPVHFYLAPRIEEENGEGNK